MTAACIGSPQLVEEHRASARAANGHRQALWTAKDEEGFQGLGLPGKHINSILGIIGEERRGELQRKE